MQRTSAVGTMGVPEKYRDSHLDFAATDAFIQKSGLNIHPRDYLIGELGLFNEESA